MDKATRLIRWQRITICVLFGGFMATALYARYEHYQSSDILVGLMTSKKSNAGISYMYLEEYPVSSYPTRTPLGPKDVDPYAYVVPEYQSLKSSDLRPVTPAELCKVAGYDKSVCVGVLPYQRVYAKLNSTDQTIEIVVSTEKGWHKLRSKSTYSVNDNKITPLK